MKIKSNIRAGKGAASKSSQINNTVISFIPPSSRCVGV
jgi:hypothetical protein